MAMIDTGDTTTSTERARRRPGPRPGRLAALARELRKVYRELSEALPIQGLKPMEAVARARALGQLLGEAAAIEKASDLEQRLASLEELARVGRH
jgi:hypothetical protein